MTIGSAVRDEDSSFGGSTPGGRSSPSYSRTTCGTEVRRCRLTPLWPRTDPAWFQCPNLKYYGPLSNFAFNCNLRHYLKVLEKKAAEAQQRK